METSLHRELKRHYAGPDGRTEVRLGRFRVDAVVCDGPGKQLIEIQHGPLWVIRDKIRQLTRRHRVRIVKPIVGRKRLVKLSRKGGRVIAERMSPRQGKLLELFDELVYFTRAFPHRNLTLEVLLVDIEEFRYPRPNRRRPWRKQFAVEDQRLLEIRQSLQIAEARDLIQLIDRPLAPTFGTSHLADALDIERWRAQRIAYVLRESGAVATVAKQRGAWIYQWSEELGRRAA
jgi:hypothetical protein